MLSFSHRTICRQVLGQISDHIPSGLDTGRRPGKPGGGGGIDAGGVVHEVGREGRTVPYLLIGKIPSQLMDNSRDHLHMAEFFGPYQGVKMAQLETAEWRGW